MKTILDPELCWRVLLTLGHFLWQGMAIALAAAAAAWMLRRASARARYGVWATALWLMMLCVVGTFVGLSTEGARTSATIPQASGPPARRVPMPAVRSPSEDGAGPAFLKRPDWRRFAPHATTAYLLGVTLMFGRLVLALGGAARLRRASEALTDPTLLEIIARRSRTMRLRIVPAVALCREVIVPTVVGVLRPVILLPVTFATGLSAEQVEFILVHELEHIRRCDCLVNLIQRVAEAALFFHPAVWLVTRRIRIEREHCCDDAVVATGCEPRSYAESLVALAEGALAARAGRCAAGLCADGGSGDLSGRVARILKVSAGREVHRLHFRPLVLVALMAISVATICAVGDWPPPVDPPDAPPGGTWRAPVDNHPQPVESLLQTDQIHDIAAGPMMIRDGTADVARENLAVNGGFEVGLSETRWPTRSGVWSGNRSTMVTAEREIQPRGGQRMLRFDMTSWGVPSECPNSQVSQIIDMSRYRDAVRAGKVRVVASAWFNRVTGGPATDRGMQISLFCFQGEHAHNFDNYEHGHHLTVASARVDTDGDVSTWERATTEVRVPAAADYVLLDLVAIENVRNDLSGPEFDGHYADDVSVRVLIDE